LCLLSVGYLSGQVFPYWPDNGIRITPSNDELELTQLTQDTPGFGPVELRWALWLAAKRDIALDSPVGKGGALRKNCAVRRYLLYGYRSEVYHEPEHIELGCS